MKILIEELLNSKTWLHSELLSSLTTDLIDKSLKDGFYEIKLLVNDVVVEPKMFNDLVNNIGKYVDLEAEKVVAEKFEDATEKLNKLNYLVESVKSNIADEFNINIED